MKNNPFPSKIKNSYLTSLTNGEHYIMLEPHPDAPSFDHSFQSPTFEKIIKDHIETYIEKYGESK